MRASQVAARCASLVLLCACGGSGRDNSSNPVSPLPPATVASVAVDHSGDSLDVGGTVQLTAIARDAQGNTVTGRTVTWTSSNIASISVSPNGLVAALALGNATVSATVDNVTGGAALRVKHLLPYLFAPVGRVLGASDIGIAAVGGAGTADVSAVQLPDGRVRVYYGIVGMGSGPGKIGSAISADGIHFTVESGFRQPSDATPLEGFASPMVIALPSGGYRLFYNGCHPAGCGVSSATSSDGLVFTADAGLRFASPNSDQNPGCGGIVRLSDGRYRTYCSVVVASKVVGIATIETDGVFSAVSSDMLAWTVENGFLVGPGSPVLAGSAAHPTPVSNSDGTTSLVYYQRRDNDSNPHEMIATSKDGRTFDFELETGLLGTEPAFLKRADGSVVLYYGGNTPGESTIYLSTTTKPK